MGFFEKLKEGLKKTRASFTDGMDQIFNSYEKVTEEFYDELEETMIMGDIGVRTTEELLDHLREEVRAERIRYAADCRQELIMGIRDRMKQPKDAYDFENGPAVVLVIGVNGVGKTTSVGKLAALFEKKGKKVLVAAADTYRAAATEQLREWTERAQVPLVAGREGADPASVIFDAVNAAKARGIDILIVDTAGRLHNKKNLMEELRKMNRILDKELADWRRENLIVLDGTTGQNALSQAHEFGEVTDLTGIVLTKLDGTAKGGIAVAIVSELNIPVKYIGVGEALDDMERFVPAAYVDALFQTAEEE